MIEIKEEITKWEEEKLTPPEKELVLKILKELKTHSSCDKVQES